MSQHAELLATLHRHGVEFIVVGGLAAPIRAGFGRTLHIFNRQATSCCGPSSASSTCSGPSKRRRVYDDLLDDSEVLQVAGLPIRVLTLDRLIAVKEKLDRPKNRLMLAVLKATRDERRKT